MKIMNERKEKIVYIMKENNTWHKDIIEHNIWEKELCYVVFWRWLNNLVQMILMK